MAIDFAKYLAMKPQVDADVLLGLQAVKEAETARNLAVATYDAIVTKVNNLVAVQKMLVGLLPPPPPSPPNPVIVPVTDVPPVGTV